MISAGHGSICLQSQHLGGGAGESKSSKLAYMRHCLKENRSNVMQNERSCYNLCYTNFCLSLQKTPSSRQKTNFQSGHRRITSNFSHLLWSPNMSICKIKNPETKPPQNNKGHSPQDTGNIQLVLKILESARKVNQENPGLSAVLGLAPKIKQLLMCTLSRSKMVIWAVPC